MTTEKLELAIEIADAAEQAAQAPDDFDLEAEAKRIVAEHPDAPVSEAEVEEVLREEVERDVDGD